MTPLTPAVVAALAQQAGESPAHLDPQVVQQVCQEWEAFHDPQASLTLEQADAWRATIDRKTQRLMADLRSQRDDAHSEIAHCTRQLDARIAERDAALAERDHERLRYDGMRADRDDWRKRCEDEQAAHALTADRYVVANRRGDGFRAALTEAHRVLRECHEVLANLGYITDDDDPESLCARVAAVLAQEEQ